MIFVNRYLYFFTYLTPVTAYFVPLNDPRMHCDLFWEKANCLCMTFRKLASKQTDKDAHVILKQDKINITVKFVTVIRL